VGAAPIVHANTDELDDYNIDNNNDIIAVGDIPQQPPHAPLIVNDTDNDDDDDDDDDNDVNVGEDEDDLLEENANEGLAAATNAQEGNESNGDQGVRRSRCRGKGTSKKYAVCRLQSADGSKAS
jgi:hypothetical protein